MLALLLLICLKTVLSDSDSAETDIGKDLISSLRKDANLDLPIDEEYEDLRAELLAYQNALASLTSRRSIISTECWRHGGICINQKLCPGYRLLSEVSGCKNRLNVCCFVWNQYEVRDLQDKGIYNVGFPWSAQHAFGGKGVVQVTPSKKKKKLKKVENTTEDSMSLLLKSYLKGKML